MNPLIRTTVRARLIGATLLLVSSSVAHAALFYNEAVFGDLSNLHSAPTPLTFSLGVNRIVGTMGGSPSSDPDIFTFTIAPGHALNSIFLQPLDPAERSFYAIASGATISPSDASAHLGSLLTFAYGEMFDQLSSGGNYGGSGFTRPSARGPTPLGFRKSAPALTTILPTPSPSSPSPPATLPSPVSSVSASPPPAAAPAIKPSNLPSYKLAHPPKVAVHHGGLFRTRILDLI